jgi:hypothetical protein
MAFVCFSSVKGNQPESGNRAKKGHCALSDSSLDVRNESSEDRLSKHSPPDDLGGVFVFWLLVHFARQRKGCTSEQTL